jgi:predicted O-linked N-acetylglucosamine transferase (SPINDLY family)
MQMSVMKIGQNDPCPCGSGREYDQCCQRQEETQTAQTRPVDTSILDVIKTAMEHHQAGRLPQAAAIYQKILQTEPANQQALYLLGAISHQTGQFETAVELISRAISIGPSGPMYYNLGVSLQALGRHDAASECYRQAISIKPDDAKSHSNLGAALQEQGKLEEAIECYRQAISIRPNDAGAHCNLGVALQAQGKLDVAVECFNQALSIEPGYAEAHRNLGLTLRTQGNLDAAVACFNQALAIKPDYAEAHSNSLFVHAHHSLFDPQRYLSLARGWDQVCLATQDRQAAHNRTFRRLPVAGRRLKVGYVSGDFRQHAVSYFVEQLFAHHDRARIELFAYTNNGQQDDVTERLQGLVEHWVPITGIPDATVRDRIEKDGIDVLIDLSGHTAHNRLGVFARRAAPVQAHYLGFFASTGLMEMDYWIGDESLTPPETDRHFSEQVWRLPRVWVSYEGKADAPRPDWKPAPDGRVWLGSFNSLSKLTPATLVLWASVLHALPEAHLLLKTKEFADDGNRRRILDAMASHGISPGRIELQDKSVTPGWHEHMAYYNRLDIALDPVEGLGGGTTTCDALWMGVPVITVEGDRMASRMTGSMLDDIDHPEWIAHTNEEYVGKVVALARNVETRKFLRISQRTQMAHSSLCDARGLAVCLENAYVEMFERWFSDDRKRSVLSRIEK